MQILYQIGKTFKIITHHKQSKKMITLSTLTALNAWFCIVFAMQIINGKKEIKGMRERATSAVFYDIAKRKQSQSWKFFVVFFVNLILIIKFWYENLY